jgi:S1-C subfamily serine protease
MTIIETIQDVIPVLSTRALATIRHIKFGSSIGTAVIFSSVGGQCWATAQHVIAGAKIGDQFQVFDDGLWKPFQFRDLVHSPVPVDCSVFTIGSSYNLKTFSLEKLPNLFFGQTLVAYGFPYGHIQSTGITPFPNPFCKRGTFSGVIDTGSAGTIVMMDAIINQGFSGGPVVCWDYQEKEIRIAGIVSRAHPELGTFGSILDVSDPQNPQQIPDIVAQIYSGYTILIPPSVARDLSLQLTKFPQPITLASGSGPQDSAS